MRVTSYSLHLSEDKKPKLVKGRSQNYKSDSKLDSPIKIAEMMNALFQASDLAEEHLWMLSCTAKGSVIGVFELAHGTVHCAYTTPREIFIRACICGAVNIILVHNHPSGDTTPSADDLTATNRIMQAGSLMGIELLDHIIIGDDYFSFLEKEILNQK